MEAVESQNNVIKTEILISELKHGMTVEKNGKFITVSRAHITFDHFLGRFCFQSDGSKDKITRIQFKVPTAFGFRLE